MTEQAILVTVVAGIETVPLTSHNSLHTFVKPPTNAPSTFYANFNNYRSVNIPTGGDTLDFEPWVSLPMPAHVFGTLSDNVVYMPQLKRRRTAGNPDNHGIVRIVAVTDPLTDPDPPSYHSFTLAALVSTNMS